MVPLTVVAAGMITGLSLIVVIGAQNALVLRQGIRREHVVAVVAVCASSDLTLILAGVAGIGSLLEHAAWLIDALRWFGAAFLVAYAIACLRRATRLERIETDARGTPTALRVVLLHTLALTWLNPHVYLDTVILLGSIAQTHGDTGRWWFGAGASLGSVAWFSALGFGASRLAPVLARPRAWQILDVTIALVMFAVAASLVW